MGQALGAGVSGNPASTWIRPLRALDGEWSIVTDCETAGPLTAALKAEGLSERLPVRSHPWLPPGTIFALRPGEQVPNGGGFHDGPQWAIPQPGEKVVRP